jgi:hypothetical protein
MEREIETGVRLQATYYYNAIVDLAHRSQVLAGHMIGLDARLAVSTAIDDEDSLMVRTGAWVIQEQLQAAGVDGLTVPGGLGKEALELLHSEMFAVFDGPGPSQGGESLVAISGQQQALKIGSEGFPLRCLGPKAIELCRIVFQRAGGSRYGLAFCPGYPSTPRYLPNPELTECWQYNAR